MQWISGGILAKNKEINKKQCHQAQVQLPTAQESNMKRQVLAKEKIALLRKLAILGRRWPPIFKNQVQTPQAVLRDYTGKRGTGMDWGGGKSLYFQKRCSHVLLLVGI